ncbi:hypothetical protein [Amycolatopsis sp. NPDC059657]|uniref:hypothetical protein n=1 Tax=Amycolatopsis sp. NPDC059657 TaxID=3346899 RepID=UPI00366E6E7F
MIDPRPLDFDDQWNVRERDPQWTVEMPADAAGWSAVLGKNAVRLTREADDVTARSTRAVSLPDAVLPSLIAALRTVQNTEACKADDGKPTGSWTHIFDADRTELYGALYVLDRRSASKCRFQIRYGDLPAGVRAVALAVNYLA